MIAAVPPPRRKRPFRGLREAPEARYDVVVVGSGIGGLIAANLLADGGLKVLLVEQHYMAGGYCSTFRRAGYTFDAATHFYPLLGNPETLTGRLLARLGVTTRWVKMDPVDVFHFPDGSRFAVPADFDAYLAALKAEFPHQAGALDDFFAAVREAYFAGLLHYFRGVPLARLGARGATATWTVMGALDRFFADRKLKLLLTADAPHWGSPPDRTSFMFDSMLRLSYFLGNYYPVGGSQSFADELVLRFEERGGHVLMNTEARRILIERGAAVGVELATLRGPRRENVRVASDVVLSNADLLLTLERLVGAEHLPPGQVEAVRRLRPTWPCWLTHLGLRGVAAGELERVQGYYWDGWDPRRMGRDALRFKLFAPTLYEPAMAPAGEQVLIVQKVLELDYDGVADWTEHKRRVEGFIFAHLERVLPRIGPRIAVASSASARTSWRFTRNHQGSMLGWEMSPEQLGEARPAIAGPVRNLFLVGHWVRPGGGITPVIVSAEQAAQAILGVARAASPSGGSDRVLAEGARA
ncbi:MAG TPA: NAD(P)/FAD-dependent oxidoreductase [Thermoanaerobaculia bacterium]|nr:NAD(P)/FAD-dependent oxidoreductase [Thermoanaerobaculia bacterium]